MRLSSSACPSVFILFCLVARGYSFTYHHAPISKHNAKRSSQGSEMKLQKMATPFFADEVKAKQKSVVVAGATGYIGNAVVQELVKRGYHTVALVRDCKNLESPENVVKYGKSFAGATIMECDVSNAQEVANIVASQSIPVDTIISCLASPTGTKSDAYKIDYQATKNCLDAGRSNGARHFVLLSAFCVRNPLLQLQQAKLKFEAELQDQTDMTYSIVRPTAFFKSVSGQLEGIQNQGVPYILFGDGAVTRCNTISEEDLGIFMCDCITEKTKENCILNIGGPDEPLTNQMLGEMMYKAVGKEPKFIYVPTLFFDSIINGLQFLADKTGSQNWEDAAETARIGKYYAVEDMLTTKEDEKFGTMSMQEHYNTIASKGQDPFTPVRATAVIARAFEVVPILLLSFVLFLAGTYPRELETIVDLGQMEFSLMVASLTNTNV